ncbi:MAG: HicB family protein [Methanobacterium sp. BAmetb5]|nr:MAG: HicB family protein [Methanobacterium sp. BAmetb5]
MKRKYKVSVIVEHDKEGYFAFSPELQGCYTQGDTYEEVMANIKDAIKLHLEERLERGEVIPEIDLVSLTSLEVEV